MDDLNGQDRCAADHRLDTLERNVVAMRDLFEAFASASTQYRRESRRDLKCISDTWSEYLPLFKMLQKREQKREERAEKIKAHVIGWGAVTAISGVIYMIGVAIQAIIEKGSP
jgi:cation transport regulator ChaB